MDFLIKESLNKDYIEKEFVDNINLFIKEKGEEKCKNYLVDVTKFFHVIIESKKFIQKQRIYNEFKKCDNGNKGYLTKKEIDKIFNDNKLENNFPINGNDKIDFGKFYNYYLIYNNIKVPSLGILTSRKISFNDI